MQPSQAHAEALRALGMLLKMRRQDRELTRQHIAQASGCSYNTIRNIEDGYHTPSALALIRYGELVGLRLEWTALHQKPKPASFR